ncbi:hypothetical protein PybrP1_010080 [[Pythium] brassicae (nom. inval.)]|nr:hypothetical protein PybrP1_010080 [[Pythium] brassicae (nom. inval.)]
MAASKRTVSIATRFVAALAKLLVMPLHDVETWEDDGESGVGDHLLHLQCWQVENVALIVARQDDSLCGRLIGAELFKLALQ